LNIGDFDLRKHGSDLRGQPGLGGFSPERACTPAGSAGRRRAQRFPRFGIHPKQGGGRDERSTL
jgi:hypothetical protein